MGYFHAEHELLNSPYTGRLEKDLEVELYDPRCGASLGGLRVFEVWGFGFNGFRV